MTRSKKNPRGPEFEAAIERLERIVKELEDGDRPLEESLRLFEEGIRLTRTCAAKLEEAQRRIDLLTRSGEGDLKLVPFEANDEEGDTDAEDPEGP